MSMLKMFVLSSACVAAQAMAAPAGYTIVDLGAAQLPYARNAAGTVVGSTAAGVADEYLNGGWRPLAKDDGLGSVAAAVNRANDAAGHDGTTPVRWHHGKQAALAGVASGTAEGIADDGTIVGTRNAASGATCFAWKAGVVTDLGTLGGAQCRAHAIDSTGKFIAGESQVPLGTGGTHAFVRDAQGMHDLGILPGGAYSWARAVNKLGHASVWADVDNSGDWAASYWNGHALVEVPGVRPIGMQSFAAGINDHDEMLVVGDDGHGDSMFLYAGRTGTVTAIEPLIVDRTGWDFHFTASRLLAGIANDGTIVGAANYNGEEHAFLLVPVTR